MIERVIIYPSAESIVWVSERQTWQFAEVVTYAYWGLLGEFRWGKLTEKVQLSRADYSQLVKGFVGKVNGRWVKTLPVMPLDGSLYPEEEK